MSILRFVFIFFSVYIMEALPSSGTPVFSIIAEDSVHDYTNLHRHKESDVQEHIPRSVNVFSLHGKFTSVIPEETEGIVKHCKKSSRYCAMYSEIVIPTNPPFYLDITTKFNTIVDI